MSMGRKYFAQALEKVIIANEVFIIVCETPEERNSLRVLLYRERNLYRKRMDPEIGNKMSIEQCDIDGKPCIRMGKPVDKLSTKTCFTVDDEGKLVPVEGGEKSGEIQRIIKLMAQDGYTEAEIENYIKTVK